MRPVLLLVFASVVLPCTLLAAPLELVRAALSDVEGGAALPAGFDHRAGETMFFSCRIAGFQKGSDEKIHLAYSVEAFDARGVPLVELFKNDITDEITPQDKEWMPKIQTEIPIPPLIAPGKYTIVIKAEDLVAKAKTETTVPFEVRGHEIAPSDTLTARNMQFFRSEEDAKPLAQPVYRAGDAVWLKFDITGFRYGPKNKIDVSYASSILDNSGKVLWTQPEPTSEQTESFYPKLYVPAVFSITVQPGTRPGPYTIAAQVKDAIGNQSYEAKATFTVE
jgi:hypothetical protein